MLRTTRTKSGQRVDFYGRELKIDEINSLPKGTIFVYHRSSNNTYNYAYYIIQPDGSMYNGYLKELMQGEFVNGFSCNPYSYKEAAYYRNWIDADLPRVAEALDKQAVLLRTNKQIKIIDAQYIDYRDVAKQLGLSHSSVSLNDEWVKVRNASSVVELIAKLEKMYLETQMIDESILKRLLNDDFFTNPDYAYLSMNSKDALFMHSLQDRLQHLYNNPNDAKIFEVKSKSEGMWLSGSEYIDPVAVIRLVKPSCQTFADSALVKHIKGQNQTVQPKQKRSKFSVTITDAQMANSVFGKRSREVSDCPWEPMQHKK